MYYEGQRATCANEFMGLHFSWKHFLTVAAPGVARRFILFFHHSPYNVIAHNIYLLTYLPTISPCNGIWLHTSYFSEWFGFGAACEFKTAGIWKMFYHTCHNARSTSIYRTSDSIPFHHLISSVPILSLHFVAYSVQYSGWHSCHGIPTASPKTKWSRWRLALHSRKERLPWKSAHLEIIHSAIVFYALNKWSPMSERNI